MVPFGKLREPLAGLRRADAVIVTRSDQPFDRASLVETIETYARPKTPVFFAHHEMTRLRRLGSKETAHLAEFVQKPVATVSGIAKPDRFNADLKKADLQIVLRRDFEDHHRYSSEEFAGIVCSAQSAKAEAIIVTEKDAANLSGEMIRQSSLPIYAAQIEFRCEQESKLKELLVDAVAQDQGT